MTRKEKCELAIEKGFIYNPETGDIFGVSGKKIYYTTTYGYIRFRINTGVKIVMLHGHQFAWYYIYKETGEEIDHKNGIRDDNRICNLRSITHQQNNFNRIKAKGCTYRKDINKWKAQITLNGKCINLGYFISQEEAHQTYLDAKKIYHPI